MLPVRVQVQQVIEHVHAGGTQAEGHEAQPRLEQQLGVEPLVRRQRGDEDEHVLGPLVHPQRLHPLAHAHSRGLEGAHLAPAQRAHLALQPRRAVHHHRPPCLAPQRQVHLAIPRVVELGVRLLEPRQLARPREVHHPIAGIHLLEQLQVRGHRMGDRLIRRGGQHQPSASRLLLVEKRQQRLAVGQARGVELHSAAHLCLEGRLALEHPQRREQQQQRVALQQHQQALVQRVGAHQRPVEIHDERHVGGRNRGR